MSALRLIPKLNVLGLNLLAAAILTLTACSQSGDDETQDPNNVLPATPQLNQRNFSAASLNRGAKLFQDHCAQCHGPEAQGHPDWQRQSKLYAAAPPLNGRGTDWRLSKSEFRRIIKYGMSRNGVAVMPAWHTRLSDRDINDILTWCQALWPSDVYEKWLKANKDEPSKPATKSATKPKTG